MADEILSDVDIKIREVLLPVVENYITTKSALISSGVAVDSTKEIDWNRGGQHVTRVEFNGGFTAKRLVHGSPNDAQKVGYSDQRFPLVSSIIPFQYQGTSVYDLFDNVGLFNRLTNYLTYELMKDVDTTLIDYTANIGDGSKQYGALGTDLTVDLTSGTNKALNYDSLIRARAKFGDSAEQLMLIVHSDVYNDLLAQDEARNNSTSIMIGSSYGITFPSLGIFCLCSDRMPILVGSPSKYTSLLCKPGAMSFGWNMPLTAKSAYLTNDLHQTDFIWRFAIMRNVQSGKQMVVKITSELTPEVPPEDIE